MEKSILNIKKHIEWLNNPLYKTLSMKAEELLKQGMVYQLGRDKKLRPVLYFDIPKINENLKDMDTLLQAICNLLSLVRKYMFLPYHVENWVILLDIKSLGMMSLPITAISKIIETTSINFCSMMDQMFILNPSFVLKAGWSVIKSIHCNNYKRNST